MSSELDERYITQEFLSKSFQSSSKEESKRKYIAFRDRLNQARARGGKDPIYDSELCDILTAYLSSDTQSQ